VPAGWRITALGKMQITNDFFSDLDGAQMNVNTSQRNEKKT